MNYIYDDKLYHYAIKGQKKGVRRYQFDDGTLTPEGKERYGKNGPRFIRKGNTIDTQAFINSTQGNRPHARKRNDQGATASASRSALTVDQTLAARQRAAAWKEQQKQQKQQTQNAMSEEELKAARQRAQNYFDKQKQLKKIRQKHGISET